MNQEIIKLFTFYANRVAKTTHYKEWSDEYCRSEVRAATADLLAGLRRKIDFSHITREEAIMLRFGKWDEDGDLYLIPLYLLPIIPVGTELTCIDGSTTIYDGHNIDTDTRLGCVAWGIHIPEVRDDA